MRRRSPRFERGVPGEQVSQLDDLIVSPLRECVFVEATVQLVSAAFGDGRGQVLSDFLERALELRENDCVLRVDVDD